MQHLANTTVPALLGDRPVLQPPTRAAVLSRRTALALPPLVLVATAQASPTLLLRVRPGPDEPPLAYGSIAAALEAAEPGATVQVAAGYYAERLLFTRPVRLESAPGAEVIVEHETEVPYEATLTVESEGVVVERLTFRHTSPSIAANYCVLVRGTGCLTMERCSVTSSTGSGLGCEGGRVSIRETEFAGCKRHGVLFTGDLEGDSPFGGSVLESCLMQKNREHGAVLRDGAVVSFRACSLTDNAGVGLMASDVELSLIGSTLARNKHGSLRAERMRALTIEDSVYDAAPRVV